MSFIWPWVFLLLLMPLTTRWASKTPPAAGAIEHPYLATIASDNYSRANRAQWPVIYWLIWSLFVIALARPVWLGPPLGFEHSGRNMMLTVDLSESMLERDMVWNNQRVSRHEAMQRVVDEFVDQRQGDYLGLVVFGSFADIQAPLTADLNAIKETLQDLMPGMAGPSTAIGDGLGLAIQRLRESDADDKVIILLSDGANRMGNLAPLQAADIAKQLGIRIHTIGFGSTGGFLRFDDIDEPTLRAIASETGGQFFRATDSKQLQDIFRALDQLEASRRDQAPQRVINEWFWLPLLLGTLGLGALQWLSVRKPL